MTIKEQIEADIKQAMLAGDKVKVTTLRGLKSSILYAEVAAGNRESGLDDQTVIGILQKESKKRLESAQLFQQGGNQEKADAEKAEVEVIARYLPAQLDVAELEKIVTAKAQELGISEMNQLGQLIGAIKQEVGAGADGAVIARLAKEYLSS